MPVFRFWIRKSSPKFPRLGIGNIVDGVVRLCGCVVRNTRLVI